MLEDNKHIDQKIKQKLEGFSMTPPEAVWNEIAPTIQQKRFGSIWFYIVGLAFIIGGVGYILFPVTNLASQNNYASLENVEKSTSVNLNKNDYDNKANKLKSEHVERSNENRTKHDNTNSDNIDLKERSSENQKLNNALKSNYTSTIYPKSNNNTYDSAEITSLRRNRINTNLNNSSSDSNKNHAEMSSHYETGMTTDENNSSHLPNSNLVSIGNLPINSINSTSPELAQPSSNFIGNNKANPFKNRLSIDLSTGIQTFRTSSMNVNDSVLEQELKTSNSNQLGYDFNASLNFSLTKQFSVFTGINYSNLKKEVNQTSSEIQTFYTLDSIGYVFDSTTMSLVEVFYETPYDSSVISFHKESITYRMLTIPFGISWEKNLSTRSSLDCSFGGELSIYGKYSGNILSNTNPANTTYKKAGVLSFGGSIKYFYHIKSQHSLYIEPWAQFGITNLNIPNSIPFDQRLYKSGIRLGYRFQF
ncbi:MAG: hypothetical protein MK066_07770 [Crocinitomicaceae bacterium]|nr:hypothetical protein [Crocinitomicaceae bacterium]